WRAGGRVLLPQGLDVDLLGLRPDRRPEREDHHALSDGQHHFFPPSVFARVSISWGVGITSTSMSVRLSFPVGGMGIFFVGLVDPFQPHCFDFASLAMDLRRFAIPAV